MKVSRYDGSLIGALAFSGLTVDAAGELGSANHFKTALPPLVSAFVNEITRLNGKPLRGLT